MILSFYKMYRGKRVDLCDHRRVGIPPYLWGQVPEGLVGSQPAIAGAHLGGQRRQHIISGQVESRGDQRDAPKAALTSRQLRKE